MLRVNARTSEIFIYDIIGADWFGEGITGQSVSEALEQLDGKRAVVRINSPGGAADEGIAIYNILKRYEGGVDTYNDSLAASAASIIFLAGENRYASEGSRVMIHKALTLTMGNDSAHLKTANTLQSYDASLIEIYQKYIDKSPEEILSLMDEETWYNTQASLEVGLATESAVKTKQKPEMAAWFKNPPQDLVVSAALPEGQMRRSLIDIARIKFRAAKVVS
jgi:ATP-dependent Clp protease, protease subunit